MKVKTRTKPINTADNKSVAFIAGERAYKSLDQVFGLICFIAWFLFLPLFFIY